MTARNSLLARFAASALLAGHPLPLEKFFPLGRGLAQPRLQLLPKLNLGLQCLRPLLQDADLEQPAVVARLGVALGRDHVRMAPANRFKAGRMCFLCEVAHPVSAQQ
jgi:hypothetical protein